MPTVELPDFWGLFDPEGIQDGSMVAVRMDGTVHCASAEAAWKEFTPNARNRAREARQGWTVRAVSREEFKKNFNIA